MVILHLKMLIRKIRDYKEFNHTELSKISKYIVNYCAVNSSIFGAGSYHEDKIIEIKGHRIGSC
jgi:hypothetical protein